MERGIEVVDQLGADVRLGQHQLNGRERILRVAMEYRDEGFTSARGLQALLRHRDGATLGESDKRFSSALDEIAYLASGVASLITGQSLTRVGQHELVAFFDNVTSLKKLSRHRQGLVVHLAGMSLPNWP